MSSADPTIGNTPASLAPLIGNTPAGLAPLQERQLRVQARGVLLLCAEILSQEFRYLRGFFAIEALPDLGHTLAPRWLAIACPRSASSRSASRLLRRSSVAAASLAHPAAGTRVRKSPPARRRARRRFVLKSDRLRRDSWRIASLLANARKHRRTKRPKRRKSDQYSSNIGTGRRSRNERVRKLEDFCTAQSAKTGSARAHAHRHPVAGVGGASPAALRRDHVSHSR